MRVITYQLVSDKGCVFVSEADRMLSVAVEWFLADGKPFTIRPRTALFLCPYNEERDS